jgi:hypothetical protein
MSLKGVCRHVRMLEGAGLVRPTRDGREKTLHLTAEPPARCGAMDFQVSAVLE